MASNEGIGQGGLLLAFVAGAVTGAAIALLYAPAVGDTTREYLGVRAREGRDKAAEAARHGREFVDRHRDTLSTAFDRGHDRFQPKGDSSGEEGA